MNNPGWINDILGGKLIGDPFAASSVDQSSGIQITQESRKTEHGIVTCEKFVFSVATTMTRTQLGLKVSLVAHTIEAWREKTPTEKRTIKPESDAVPDDARRRLKEMLHKMPILANF